MGKFWINLNGFRPEARGGHANLISFAISLA